ncbi:hypothetical protein FA10DRAFT_303769 [Acaromyces ingoldii]|uniref:Uncharacterized protein n=1 Tax=Acaromyces ingoldii TaxID=215250 RepID=A0A316YEQ7_9BASI|nr:hypothetical protein FA10DRAFT_303769 [Acaromyces ingoldii]PWN87652.1 hypothetical protein FA10DRAFT_303769 [Acaromyces ingoldii]
MERERRKRDRSHQHQQLPHQQHQHQQHQQQHQSSLMDAFPSNGGGDGGGVGASFYHAPSAAFANFASMAFASGSGSGHQHMGNGSNDAVAMPFAQLPAHVDAGMAGYEDEEGDEDEEEDDEDDDEEGGGRPDGAAHRGSSSSSSQQGGGAAAAAGAGSCFQCPYCEKRYTGKHARSIWRRHLQDKHAIPLSQQPRRTRWDGDMNRPKNAEERRQRMLESKRRWARKKRLAEKGLTAPTTDDDDDEGGGQSAVRPAAPSQSSRRARASSHSVAQAHAHAQAPQLLPPQQSQQQQSQQQAQQQHQQQQPQTQTQPMMPAFFEAGGFPTMPLASAAAVAGPRSAWPSAESSLAAARDFGRPHDAVAMMANIASPRQALAQLDGNQGVASSRFIKIKDETRAVYDKQQQSQQQQAQQAHTQQSQHPSQHKTPVNRFSQLYPTPPSMGSGSGSGDSLRFSLDGFFSSTPRQHVSGQHQQQQRGKHSQPLLSPPTSTHAESSPSNAKHNPFSLDRHRVSPRAAAAAAAAASAAATTTASPVRAGLAAHSPVRSNKRGSPTARRLPPLMRTPLFGGGGGGTSTDASPLALNRAFGGARSRPQRAKVETPTEDHMERMLGFTPIKARQPTPRRKESSERHQVSRAGAGAGGDPSSDDGSNNNGDSGESSGGGDNEGLPALFSSPAHPNLTQSLGLAPHRSGLASINATPFAKLQPLLGHSLGASSLQWPDSVVRPSMYRRADDDDDGLSLGDDDDDDDDDDGPPQGGDGSPARKRSRVSSKPAVASSTMTTPRRLGPLASPTFSSSSSSLSSSKWLKLRADDLAASSSADDNGHLAPRPALAERRAN